MFKLIRRIPLVFLNIICLLQFATGQTLTLDKAIAMALDQNLDLQMVRNDAEIAAILNNWGNAGRYPTVNGAAGFNFSNNNLNQELANGTIFKRSGASFQSQSISAVATWRLYNGGRVLAVKRRLDAAQKMADTETRLQANNIVYQIVSAYLNALRFQQQITATTESMKAIAERKALAENRFKVGTSGKMDFLQAQIDLNEVANLLIVAENNLQNAKAEINTLLSRDPAFNFNLSDSMLSVVPFQTEGLLAAIDTLNPSLINARMQSNILVEQRKEINAQRLPMVSLSAGGGLNNSKNSAGFTLRNTTYGPNAGVQLNVPIFQGGIVKQSLRVNEVQQKNQFLFQQQLRNRLANSLTNALNNYRAAFKRLELEKSNLAIVLENNFIAMERFKKASITNVELRQIQLILVDSQTRMIQARYDLKQAEADVLLLLGRFVE